MQVNAMCQRDIHTTRGFTMAKLLCLPWGAASTCCCSDDLCRTHVCKSAWIGHGGHDRILLQAYDAGLISFAEFEDSLDDLEYYDFWLAPT